MSRKFEHSSPYAFVTTYNYDLPTPSSNGPVCKPRRKRSAGVATARKSRPTNASGTGKNT